MRKINVSFFGSSEFSIATLNRLLDDDQIEVKSIITMPPVEKNRGKKLSNNIVHDFALKKGFDNNFIFTPNVIKNNNTLLNILKSQDLDFIIVVAYGKIITKDIINLPKYEILNLHPSRLPKYRGAAPIERAIENNEKEIDICIMKVDVGLDTGDVAIREKYLLNTNMFANEVIPEIAENGASLMILTIKKIINNDIIFQPQDSSEMVYANKIDKSELLIDFNNQNLDALNVYNKIRAFNNSGCCYFFLEGYRVKIIKAELESYNDKNYNYKYIGFDKNNGKIFLKNGIIKPTILQKEGRKPILLKDFLNGLR